MSETSTMRVLRSVAIVASVAAAAVLGRALLLDEALSGRLFWLTTIAAAGGTIAVGSVMLTLSIFRYGGRVIRSITGAMATGLIFVPATLACFAFKIRILDGRIEGDLAEGIASGRIIFSLIGAMGMFTPTGLRYLAPWPIAAVTLAAGLVLWRWPMPRSPLEKT